MTLKKNVYLNVQMIRLFKCSLPNFPLTASETMRDYDL